jgi:UDP-N-acetylglucosamine acyltransferase
MNTSIHPTAIVDPKAELGVEVQVGPFSVIGPNVKIGDRCVIKSHAVVDGFTTVDEATTIFPFASVGGIPQDLKFKGEPSVLIIGKRNTIREYVTLQPGTENGGMETRIGDGNLFMACSHVAHDCKVGNNNIFANSATLAGHVTLANNVILGGLTAIHQFCRIGDFVMTSGGSMVNKDVPPYCMVQGDRATLRGLNLVGLKRAGFTPEEISEVKKVYRTLFGSKGNLQDKISQLPVEITSKSRIKTFLDFFVDYNSERGVVMPAKELN